MEWLPLLMFVAVCLVLLTGYPVAFVLGGTALLFAAGGILVEVLLDPARQGTTTHAVTAGQRAQVTGLDAGRVTPMSGETSGSGMHRDTGIDLWTTGQWAHTGANHNGGTRLHTACTGFSALGVVVEVSLNPTGQRAAALAVTIR